MAYKGEIIKDHRLTDLDQYALFDRIINIKFIRKKGDHFVIRSDYEVVEDSNGQPYFRVMKQKPSINVEYEQLANSTSINVSIRIHNLHFTNMGQDDNIMSNAGNPIVKAIVQMGYRSQFPDWTSGVLASDSEEDKKNRLEMFYNMEDVQIKGAKSVLDTGSQIVVTCLDSFYESLPPDSVLYIDGIVGSHDYGLRWQEKGRDLYTYFNDSSNYPEDRDYTPIEKLLFLVITRRFVAPTCIYRFEDSRNESSEDNGEIVQKLSIRDYTTEDGFLSEKDQEGKGEDKRWFDIKLDGEGFMPIEDALNIGVPCVVSEKLKTKSRENRLSMYNPDGNYYSNEDACKIPKIAPQKHIQEQMIMVTQVFPSVRFTVRPDGLIYVYDKEESIGELNEQAGFKRAMRQTKPRTLPAVYDIKFDTFRIIRAPFVSFIAPLQKVCFSAKYFIGSFIGFYYQPEGEDAWFQVIFNKVSFSTVEDNNEMVLSCVDTSKPAEEESEEESEDEKAKEKQKERKLKWKKVQIAAPSISGEYSKDTICASSWYEVAERIALNRAMKGAFGFYPADSTEEPPAVDFLKELASKNKSFINSVLDDTGEEGADNTLYGEEGIKLCALHVGDEIEIPYVEE